MRTLASDRAAASTSSRRCIICWLLPSSRGGAGTVGLVEPAKPDSSSVCTVLSLGIMDALTKECNRVSPFRVQILLVRLEQIQPQRTQLRQKVLSTSYLIAISNQIVI